MKTKEEVIRESWQNSSMPKKLEDLTGCFWYRCKRSQVEHLKEEFDFIYWDLTECSIRPKSLSGIENNNGWIKIENEEDLPKDNEDYWVVIDGEIKVTHGFSIRRNSTHYQPIVKPRLPIY